MNHLMFIWYLIQNGPSGWQYLAFAMALIFWTMETTGTLMRWGIREKKIMIKSVIAIALTWMITTLFHIGSVISFYLGIVVASIICGYWASDGRKLDAFTLWALPSFALLEWMPASTESGLVMVPGSFWIGLSFLLMGYAVWKMAHVYWRHAGQVNAWVCVFVAAVELAGLLIPNRSALMGSIGFFTDGILCVIMLVWGGIDLLRFARKDRKKEPSHEKPLLLFDLDGTLIDSQPLVFETFRQVFAQKKPGYVLSEEELYSFFGPTLETTFARYFPQEEIPAVIDLYQAINLRLHESLLKPMPHAREVLTQLKEQGYPIGIVSNKRKEPVLLGVSLSDLGDCVDLIYGKEDLPSPKPEPDGLLKAAMQMGYGEDNVIYIGDAASDIQAAKNMGAFSIGYTIDAKQRKTLEQKKGCVLLDDLRQLPALLQEDRTWNDKSIW